MRKVHTAESTIEAAHLRNVLEADGIACFVRNDRLASVIGEIPFIECWPELWVAESGQELRARGLIEQALRPRPVGDPWVCPGCGSTSMHSSPSAGAARAMRSRRSRVLECTHDRPAFQRPTGLRQWRLRVRSLRGRDGSRPAGPARRAAAARSTARCAEGRVRPVDARIRGGNGRPRYSSAIAPRRAGASPIRAGGVGIAALCGIPRALLSRLLRLRTAPAARRWPEDLSGIARHRDRRGAVAAGGRARCRGRQGRGPVPLGGSRLPGLLRSLRRSAPDGAGEMHAHVDRRVRGASPAS